MWVISLNYPVFLALIFLECFFSKKRYLFGDVATNWARLYYCVRWYLNTEGQPTVRPTTCRLLRLLFCNRLRGLAIQGFDFICFTRVERMQSSHKGNTTNNILLGMRGLAFRFEMFQKGVVSGIEMRGLAIMEQETTKWTDPPTTQHVHSLGCGATVWAPIQVPPASLVFILWSPLASLPNSDGRGSQLGSASVINKRNVGPFEHYQ